MLTIFPFPKPNSRRTSYPPRPLLDVGSRFSAKKMFPAPSNHLSIAPLMSFQTDGTESSLSGRSSSASVPFLKGESSQVFRNAEKNPDIEGDLKSRNIFNRSNMWEAAIRAVKTSDQSWITKHRKDFHEFFRAENEKPAGKLGVAALKHHYEEQLFKMFVTTDFSGLELPLEEGGKWIENAAILNPNWGWLLAIGVGGAYFQDYMAPEIAEKYFSPKEALVAGSGKPDGTAARTSANSWLVNGSWSYCSGSEQASLFTAVTKKEGKISAFILPVAQARLDRDWNAIGLPLTCSHTVTAENAEIPEDHFFDLMQDPRTSDYPLSTYPFMLFAQICFVPVIIGITRAFWMETAHYLNLRSAIWKEFQPERYEFIKGSIDAHSSRIAFLKSNFHKLVKESWRQHLEGKAPNETKVSETGLAVAEYCYKNTAMMIPKLGMGVLEKDHPIQQLWQDLQTAYQHMAFHRY